MAGIEARQGFRFQDLILIERILEFCVRLRQAEIAGTPPPASPSFSIEAVPATGSPDWDLVEVQVPATTIALEEVKSGVVVTKDDRSAFWRRLRRTAVALAAAKQIVVPRLTVDSVNFGGDRDLWRSLSAESQATALKKPPQRVSTKSALAMEALWMLTRRTKTEPGLTLREARDVLARFEFNDQRSASDLETNIAALVATLSKGLAVNEICRLIVGDVVTRAADASSSEHTFEASDVLHRVTLLERFTKVPPAAAQLWRDLVRLSDAVLVTLTGAPSGGLAYQDWRLAQPAAAAVLDASGPARTAVIGRGGLGKTVLTRALARQQLGLSSARVLWVDGSTLRGVPVDILAEALDLGAFLSRTQGQRLSVFVDSLETAADDSNQLADVASVLQRATEEAVLTVRSTTWNSIRGSQSAVAGFRIAELHDWDEQLVLQLTRSSQRPDISADLVRVLSTPLLLDIFLRAFGLNEIVPPGLQTRHHVLEAYWRRRILPDSDPRALERRQLLDATAQEEAQGISSHASTGVAALQLASEGLFIVIAGRLVFRHPLLRDFAISMWATADGTPKTAIDRIGSITNSLVRYGTARAVIEASSSPAPSNGLASPPLAHLLADASSGEGLLLLAEVLGEMEDPSVVPIRTLDHLVGESSEAPAFGTRIVDVARLSQNRAWLDMIANLPAGAEWVEAQRWVGHSWLLDVCKLLEVLRRDAVAAGRNVDASLFRIAGARIRSWSRAPKFQPFMDEYEGWGWGAIVDTIAECEPTNECVSWLVSLVAKGASVRRRLLPALPLLVVRASEDGALIDDAILEQLFLSAAGLTWSAGALLEDPTVAVDQLTDYHRIDVALLGRGVKNRTGLLSLRPNLGLRLAFGIISGKSQARRGAVSARWYPSKAAHDLDAMIRGLFPKAPELDAIVAELQSVVQPPLSVDQTLGSLINDLENARFWENRRDGDAQLVRTLLESLEASLAGDGTYLQSTYWPSARASESALARLLLLHVLVTKLGGERYSQIVDEILLDKRLYHCSYAQSHLADALQNRWPYLSDPHRQLVVVNIQSVMRSPVVNGPFAMIYLLHVIPEEHWPVELKPLMAEAARRGWFDRKDHDDHEAIDGPQEAPEELIDQFLGDLEGLSDACMAAWRRFRRWKPDDLKRADDAKLRLVIADVEACLECLPGAEALRHRLWALMTMSTFLGELRVHAGARKTAPQLTPPQAEAIFRWALGLAASMSTEEINRSQTPVPVRGAFSSSESGFWPAAFDVAGEALMQPALREDDTLLEEYLAEIRRVAVGISPTVARSLLAHVHPWHWFRRSNPTGRQLLLHMLYERIKDVGALTWSLRQIGHFSGDEQEQIFRHWLLTDDALPEAPANAEFAGELGAWLGASALYRTNDKRRWPYRFVVEMLEGKPTTGLLRSATVYRQWIIGLAFGLKEACDKPKLPDWIPQDFAELTKAAWRALQSLDPDDTGHNRFVLFGFYPLTNSVGKPRIVPAVATWWSVLSDLAVEVIKHGRNRDVSDLVFELREASFVAALGTPSLAQLVDALDERTRAEQRETLLASNGRENAWPRILEYAAELIQNIGTFKDADATLRARAHALAQRWADLGVARALAAARAIRTV